VKKSSIARATLVACALTVASVSQAGIMSTAVKAYKAKEAATTVAAVAGVGGAAVAAGRQASPASAAQAQVTPGAAAGVIEHAEKTQAAAQGVVNGNLANGKGCTELVRAGVIPATTMSQYKCILTGPKAAEAAARAKAAASASAK
jgi:hypothetical protein